jgi:hypothetical protein
MTNQKKTLTTLTCPHVDVKSMKKEGEIVRFLEDPDGLLAFHWCGNEPCNSEYSDIVKMWEQMLNGN